MAVGAGEVMGGRGGVGFLMEGEVAGTGVFFGGGVGVGMGVGTGTGTGAEGGGEGAGTAEMLPKSSISSVLLLWLAVRASLRRWGGGTEGIWITSSSSSDSAASMGMGTGRGTRSCVSRRVDVRRSRV